MKINYGGKYFHQSLNVLSFYGFVLWQIGLLVMAECKDRPIFRVIMICIAVIATQYYNCSVLPLDIVAVMSKFDVHRKRV